MELIKTNIGSYFYYPCKKQKKSTIVFIHGFATTSAYHNPFIKYINDDYDYIALQLPGAGIQKWNSKKQPKVEDMVNYCIELIKSLDLDEFILIGHSMGGGIAKRVAYFFNDQVTCLICSTPMNSRLSILQAKNYFVFNPKTFKKTFKLLNILYADILKTYNNDEEMIEKITNEELDYQVANHEFLSKLKKSMFSLKNRDHGRFYEKNIKCPTLIIGGKYDKIITLRSLTKVYKHMKKNNPNVKFEIMSNSAHLPFIEEETYYAKEIIDFIKLWVN